MISQCPASATWAWPPALLGVSAGWIHSVAQGCSLTWALSPLSNLTSGWQNSVSCSYRTEFSCWLCWDLLQIWEAILMTWGPLHRPFAAQLLTSSRPRGRCLLFLLSLTSSPSFKGLVWLGQTHPDNLPFDWLKANWLGTLMTPQDPSTFARWRNLITRGTPYHTHGSCPRSRGRNYAGGWSPGAISESCAPHHLMKSPEL